MSWIVFGPRPEILSSSNIEGRYFVRSSSRTSMVPFFLKSRRFEGKGHHRRLSFTHLGPDPRPEKASRSARHRQRNGRKPARFEGKGHHRSPRRASDEISSLDVD